MIFRRYPGHKSLFCGTHEEFEDYAASRVNGKREVFMFDPYRNCPRKAAGLRYLRSMETFKRAAFQAKNLKVEVFCAHTDMRLIRNFSNCEGLILFVHPENFLEHFDEFSNHFLMRAHFTNASNFYV